MLGHSCGYYLADRATELRTMQDYLGHRDPKHAAHYTGVVGHWVRRAMEVAWQSFTIHRSVLVTPSAVSPPRLRCEPVYIVRAVLCDVCWSRRRISVGNVSQGCLLSHQTATVGAGKCGSAKQPTAITTAWQPAAATHR